MNYKKVKRHLPKAWSTLIEWYASQDIEVTDVSKERIQLLDQFGIYHLINIRDLFDFFDQHEIYVGVYRNGDGFMGEIMLSTWMPETTMDGDTRTEAEEKIFEHAFELLNNT